LTTEQINAQWADQQLDPEEVAAAADAQRWALAEQIAKLIGKDASDVYAALTYWKTIGGNSEFTISIDELNLLTSDELFDLTNNAVGCLVTCRAGFYLSPHIDDNGPVGPDGLPTAEIHLDTFNGNPVNPVGTLLHFFADIIVGGYYGGMPMPRSY
jgi:hypothetical protein